jgi:hypothetical protein
MLARFRSHRPSHGTVVAYLALFVALGGTTYAAATVGAGNIKNNAVRSRHIKDGQVNREDLNPGLLDNLTPSCPSSTLHRAGDICFETDTRSGATWLEAVANCARAQMRLPTAAELALAYDHLGAPQLHEWVAGYYIDNTGTPPSGGGPAYGETLTNTASRQLNYDIRPVTSTVPEYRCVTSPTARP